MVEAKFSFCFIRVALIDCLAFEDRDWPQHSMWSKSWEHPRTTQWCWCATEITKTICNTDIQYVCIHSVYAVCMLLPSSCDPVPSKSQYSLLFMMSCVQTPLKMLGWVSGCQTQVFGTQTTTRGGEGYLYLSYILSECKILKKLNKMVSQLFKKGERKRKYIPKWGGMDAWRLNVYLH